MTRVYTCSIRTAEADLASAELALHVAGQEPHGSPRHQLLTTCREVAYARLCDAHALAAGRDPTAYGHLLDRLHHSLLWQDSHPGTLEPYEVLP